jgi:hypothetical protein
MAVTEQERAMIFRLRNEDGQSERAIAKVVGYAPSTVHEVLAGEAPSENGNGSHLAAVPEATPGQQTIDGGEVPAPAMPVEDLRVDGLVQLGMFDAGGKKPQSATVALAGLKPFNLVDGKAFSKGDRVYFSGVAQVFDVGQKDTLDKATMIATTAVQYHKAQVFELHAGDEGSVLRAMFRALVRADRQAAAALADELVREANGGGS